MKKILLLTTLCVLFNPKVYSQQVVSYQLIKSYSIQQCDSIFIANGIPSFILSAKNGVNIYKVVYQTVSYDSSQSIASGAMLVPDPPACAMPLVSYQHGTILEKNEVPSTNYGEIIIGIALSSAGYTVSMPDYIGLGDSPIPLHPYIHANSEASASVDMLRATKTLITDTLNFALNNQLFLVGYSQGGHATMALQRLIETSLTSEFTITASAPMSGPYDISGVQASVITNDSAYSQPVFLPYVLFSLDEVYNLIGADSSIFVSPYDTLLRPLFDGYHGSGFINALMPAEPNDILHLAVLDSFRNDSNHYFRLALRLNDVYDWAPITPTRLFYCNGDDQVIYTNALVAEAKMIQNGSTSVSSFQVSPFFNHADCAQFALIIGKAWFDSLRKDLLQVQIMIQNATSAVSNDGSLTANVTQGGTLPFSYAWSNGASGSTNNNLAPGLYTVTITDALGCSVVESATVGITTGIFSENIEDKISLYPNPANDFIAADISKLFPFDNFSVYIEDISGRRIQTPELRLNKKYFFNIKELNNGLYFLTINLNETFIHKKFMVSHY